MSSLVRTGRILAILFALFMLGAWVAPKLIHVPATCKPAAQLGWPPMA